MVSQSERRAATIEAVLAAARRHFASEGFDATTIDSIAATAGVAKGAVYHHFASKEDVFERVLESIQGEIAAAIPAAVRPGKSPLDRFARGTLKFLTAATAPDVRRILLIDGPAVLGWHKWREIDQRHFGRFMKLPANAVKSPAEMEALAHLLTGAITEAALICAVADKPQKMARDLTDGIRQLLSGIFSEWG